MGRRSIFTALAVAFCLICFVGILIVSSREDPPAYVWVPFEASGEEAKDILLVLEENTSIPMGYRNFQLTVTNNSPYTIVISSALIGIQKFENASWHFIQKIQPQVPRDSKGHENAGGVLPSNSCTYDLLLSDLFPLPLQTPGEYRIYCPFYFRLNEQDPSQTLVSYVTIPITITDQ